jgi:hypothetical protein
LGESDALGNDHGDIAAYDGTVETGCARGTGRDSISATIEFEDTDVLFHAESPRTSDAARQRGQRSASPRSNRALCPVQPRCRCLKVEFRRNSA